MPTPPGKIYNLHDFRKAKLALIAKYGTLLLEGGGPRAEELYADVAPLAKYAGVQPGRIVSGLATQMQEAAPK